MSSRNHLRKESSPFSALAAVELSCRNGTSLPTHSQQNGQKEMNTDIRRLVGVSQVRLLKGPVRTIWQLPVVRRYVVNNNDLHHAFQSTTWAHSAPTSTLFPIFCLFFNYETLSRTQEQSSGPTLYANKSLFLTIITLRFVTYMHTHLMGSI